MNASEESADQALRVLLEALGRRHYRFVAPTPATHRRVLGRNPGRRASDLRDVFGWGLPFDQTTLPPDILELLERADVLIETPVGVRSALGVASLGDHLFLHSAFPADGPDAVFFGPDSYRFADFLRHELTAVRGEGTVLVDVGAGCGVGGIIAAGFRPEWRPILTDVNPLALRLARINAQYAGVAAETVEGRGLAGIAGAIGLAVANPPFIAEDQGHTDSDGGLMHGDSLSLDWAKEAMAKLAPDGVLLLYTGSAIVGGKDPLREALKAAACETGCALRYRELDVDIFGEELSRPAYADVERIAAVGAAVTRTT